MSSHPRKLAAVLTLVCMAFLSRTQAAQLEAPRTDRPNVVFILADDLGYMDISPNNPRTFYETPNLERLAAQGERFTDAYAACPVCSPTRASILTGKYPARLGLTDFIHGPRPGKAARAPHPLLPPECLDHLPLEEVTLPEALKEAGYTTAIVGKWHLGGAPYLPETQGFDVNIGAYGAGSPSSYFSPYNNPKLADGPAGESLTERLTTEALRFIETNAHRPFFLYLAHYTVHIPLQAKKEIVAKYQKKAAGHAVSEKEKFKFEGESRVRQVQDQPVYAAMVQSLDESVGRVLDKLDQLGISTNTVVIFFSDNGGLATAEGTPTANVPLRGGKGWLYEGGIREPLLIKWPAVVKPGGTCSSPVMSTDFYPTILAMAGIAPRPQQHRDGASFMPLLKGESSWKREPLFWHYPHYSNQGGQPGCAVRSGDWKLIRFFADNKEELYDLKTDLGETRDLAATNPERVRELNKVLDKFLKETGAAFPKPNPDFRAGESMKRTGP